MRTTFQTTHRKIQTDLQKVTTEMARLNESISSQRQMSKLSDDPVSLVSALGLRTSLTEVKQFQENLTYGTNVIDASENALVQMKELLIRAKTLALQSINSATNADNRASIALEVENLLEETVSLGNTQINGKFVFGGYKTSGYTATEPAPFIAGYSDGYNIQGKVPTTLDTVLTGKIDTGLGQNIIADDFLINGIDIGPVDLTSGGLVPPVTGLNMFGASELAAAIDGNTFGNADMTATLTTLTYSDNVSQAIGGAGGTVTATINGTAIAVNFAGAATAAQVNSAMVTAINAQTASTGVTADIGDTTNGAGNGVLILKNARTGDNSQITVTIADTTTGTNIAFAGSPYVADATHNTGEVSLSGTAAFEITSNNVGDDTILNLVGLGGGSKGFVDQANDGVLLYGYQLGTGDLTINGIAVGAATDDGRSDIYADASAEAKANAINAVSTQTGVEAVIIPVYHEAGEIVTAGTMGPGDLVINGVDIFSTNTTILSADSDNSLMDAINAKEGQTGIAATRDSFGKLILTPIKTITATGTGIGRNLHIQTSANGERISHLNGSTSAIPLDKVYFGSIQLKSDRPFALETTPMVPSGLEPGLATLGLEGGVVSTGEANDVADDGKLSVFSFSKLDDNIRYTGDKDNDLAIKTGKGTSLTVSKNGQDALKGTGVFEALQNLADYLKGMNFSSVTGVVPAADVTAKLDSGDTGLPREDELTNGSFTVTVTDHAQYPPKDFSLSIGVDTANDTLSGIAKKINGVPGMEAYWDSDGYLHIDSIDSSRYTIDLSDHTSNFLEIVGIRQEDIQFQALDQSLVEIDTTMSQLSNQIADFGARANRMIVQGNIYDSLELATSETLSEKQDTDIIEALMRLTAKETAYQAALSAASKTIQLSLVDYL